MSLLRRKRSRPIRWPAITRRFITTRFSASSSMRDFIHASPARFRPGATRSRNRGTIRGRSRRTSRVVHRGTGALLSEYDDRSTFNLEGRKAPSTKHQAPEKLQTSNIKNRHALVVHLSPWGGTVVWCLGY